MVVAENSNPSIGWLLMSGGCCHIAGVAETWLSSPGWCNKPMSLACSVLAFFKPPSVLSIFRNTMPACKRVQFVASVCFYVPWHVIPDCFTSTDASHRGSRNPSTLTIWISRTEQNANLCDQVTSSRSIGMHEKGTFCICCT